MKIKTILLSILLLGLLVLSACGEKPNETQPNSALPTIDLNGQSGESAAKADTQESQDPAQTTQPIESEGPAEPNDSNPVVETTEGINSVEQTTDGTKEFDFEVVDEYTVEVDGPVGIGGN